MSQSYTKSAGPLKVMHLVAGTKIWGIERYILTLARNLRLRGIEVAFVCLHDGDMSRQLREEGFPVVMSPLRHYLDVKAFYEIRAAVLDFQPHVIHAHMGLDSFFGALISAHLSIPLVLSAHFDNPAYTNLRFPMRGIWRVIQVWKNRSVSHFLPITEAVAVSLSQRESVLPEKMTVVSPGIPIIDAMAPAVRLQARQSLNIASGELLVASIGRLNVEKGMDVLIDAFARVIKQSPNARLRIVGEGSERAALEKQIVELALDHSVKLLGYAPNPKPLLEAADLFVLASREEPFGIAALEAMAHNLAVVGTSKTGLATIVEDGVTGYLTPSDDSESLAAAIVSLLQNGEQRRLFGGAGRIRVVEQFSDQKMVEQILQVYQRVAAGPGTLA